ncbi:MAG TPA: integration host factor subunit beta [Gammaproteobacteria bacterium]|nr:integration host factor subunit beta [Gammaproteobacteria bacterium]
MLIKSQLIAELSKQLSYIPEKDIMLGVNQILNIMGDALSNGDRIEIRGFGSFSLHYRPPRKAHNPKTGEKLMTEPKYAAHFKPGKELRDKINANKHLPLQDSMTADDSDDEEE